jgi:hypothetical protein
MMRIHSGTSTQPCASRKCNPYCFASFRRTRTRSCWGTSRSLPEQIGQSRLVARQFHLRPMQFKAWIRTRASPFDGPIERVVRAGALRGCKAEAVVPPYLGIDTSKGVQSAALAMRSRRAQSSRTPLPSGLIRISGTHEREGLSPVHPWTRARSLRAGDRILSVQPPGSGPCPLFERCRWQRA